MTELETHLLGYLKPTQWADAIKNHGYSKKEVGRILDRQEEVFPTHIKSEVEKHLEGEFP